MRVALLILLLVVVGLGGALALAKFRWRSHSSVVLGRLMHGVAAPNATYSTDELDGLPAPVARCFRAVLRDGQPLVRSGRLVQEGEFLVRPTPDGWRPFSATQHFAVRPAGFLWDARIRMALGVPVHVRDAFVDGTGSMNASVLALFTMLKVEGTPEIAAGALHRYLAEAVWFPTALLPSQGVVWSPLDESKARATLTAGNTTVWLDFLFGEDGLVRACSRPSAPAT